MYVNGYFQGHLRGILEGGIVGGLAALNYKGDLAPGKMNPAKLAKMQTEIRDQIGTGKHKLLDTVEIEEGMTAFYRDFRNQKVCWPIAFKFSALSLSGDTPTEQELQAAREADA